MCVTIRAPQRASATRSFFTARNTLCLLHWSQPERGADLVDRASSSCRSVNAARSSGLSSGSAVCTACSISALCAMRSGPARRPPAGRRLRSGCRHGPDRAAPASNASDPPNSSRRCDTTGGEVRPHSNRPSCRYARRKLSWTTSSHLLIPPSSGTPAGRRSGCVAPQGAKASLSPWRARARTALDSVASICLG